MDGFGTISKAQSSLSSELLDKAELRILTEMKQVKLLDKGTSEGTGH